MSPLSYKHGSESPRFNLPLTGPEPATTASSTPLYSPAFDAVCVDSAQKHSAPTFVFGGNPFATDSPAALGLHSHAVSSCKGVYDLTLPIPAVSPTDPLPRSSVYESPTDALFRPAIFPRSCYSSSILSPASFSSNSSPGSSDINHSSRTPLSAGSLDSDDGEPVPPTHGVWDYLSSISSPPPTYSSFGLSSSINTGFSRSDDRFVRSSSVGNWFSRSPTCTPALTSTVEANMDASPYASDVATRSFYATSNTSGNL